MTTQEETMKIGMTMLGFVSVMVLAPALGSAADELPREATLPMSLALKAATAALEKCKADGYKVGVAVVDRGGVVRVLLRGDGAGAHTADSSARKAYTSATLGRTTSELAEIMLKFPHLQELGKMNERVLVLGGGLPIEIGGDVVAAIGVGGAPGTQFDDACGQAGLDAIGAAPKVQKK